MKTVVAINLLARSDERDYSLRSRCRVVETRELLGNHVPKRITVYLHANDVRHNCELRRQILARAKTFAWSLQLFTNTSYRPAAIHGVPNEVVFTWNEIEQSFPKLPSLARQQEQHYLVALAILCQGFLGTYYESQNGKVAEPEVKRALKAMGWPKLAQNAELRRRLQSCWFASEKTSTSEPRSPRYTAWWIFPFKRTVLAKDSFENLCRSLKREWNGHPRTIKDLLQLIRNGEIDRPAVVARAYLDLTQHLSTPLVERNSTK